MLACLEIQFGCAYICRMALRSFGRGRPLNAPAAFIHRCQPIVVVLMNLKAIIAISLAAAVPQCAQAQSPSVPTVTKVVTIIGGDQAKTQTYCDLQNLGEQMERAYEKRNLKLVDELLQKIETLEKTLGAEYVALIDGLQDIIDIRSSRQAVYEVGARKPGSRSKIPRLLRQRVRLTERFRVLLLLKCCGAN
jgi:hypothetical protein